MTTDELLERLMADTAEGIRINRLVNEVVTDMVKRNTTKYSHGYAYTTGFLQSLLVIVMEKLDSKDREYIIQHHLTPKLENA